MPVSVYYQDGREEVRRLIFLKLVVTQCCVADPEESEGVRKALSQLHVRLRGEVQIAQDNWKDSDDWREISREIANNFWDVFEQTRRALPRPIAQHIRNRYGKRLARRVIAFIRGEKLHLGWDWQSPDEPGLKDPNPVLRWYLREMEPVICGVERAYERALRTPLAVHVNVALLPKKGNDGPTNGVTRRRDIDAADNPKPLTGSPGRVVAVEIFLPVDFNSETAFMVPYTVAHEFGVHALQQLDLPNAPNAVPGRWQFSEGFMDAVITNLLDGILDDPNAAHPHNPHRKISAASRHRLRISEELPPSAVDRRIDWTTQLIMGEKCWSHLQDLARSAAEAGRLTVSQKSWAMDVALRLNTLPLEAETRDDFLIGFSDAYLAMGGAISLPAEDELRLTESGQLYPIDEYFALFQQIHDLEDRQMLAILVKDLVQRETRP